MRSDSICRRQKALENECSAVGKLEEAAQPDRRSMYLVLTFSTAQPASNPIYLLRRQRLAARLDQFNLADYAMKASLGIDFDPPLTSVILYDACTILAAMKLSADEGNFDVLDLMIRHRGPFIDNNADPLAKQELGGLRTLLASARRIEAVYGKGCLLALDRASVQRKISKGWIDQTSIDNAHGYPQSGVR